MRRVLPIAAIGLAALVAAAIGLVVVAPAVTVASCVPVKIKALLSHTKYQSILQEMTSCGLIRRTEKTTRFGTQIYSFLPVFFQPVRKNNPIRNLKVRNGVRRYLAIDEERVTPRVFRWVMPGLKAADIRISKEEFFADMQKKYERYKQRKISKGERYRSPEGYERDMWQIYRSLVQYQELNASRRVEYVWEDEFSGRIYNIATGVPRWLRKYIFIAGEPVAEIDMQSSHAVLLWKIVPRTDFIRFLWDSAVQGRDIYDAYGERVGICDRREVKFRFLRGLYSKPTAKYSLEFKKIFPEAGKELDEIKTNYNPFNPSCRAKGCHTNLAFRLLNLEVKIFRKIWESFWIHEIPFLSIHDGILVPSSRLGQARSIMDEVLRKEIPVAQTKTVISWEN